MPMLKEEVLHRQNQDLLFCKFAMGRASHQWDSGNVSF